MKRFRPNLMVLAAALFLVAGAVAFAGGQKEAPSPKAPNATSGSAPEVTVAKNLTTVTGKIDVVNRIFPVVTSGSTSYELIVPRFAVYQSEVKEGQTVTIKGYVVEGWGRGPYGAKAQNPDTTPRLLVSSATIDGKTYDLSQWADHFKLALEHRGNFGPQSGFRGPWNGRMQGSGPRGWNNSRGGYGPGYGMGYGPGFGPGMGD